MDVTKKNDDGGPTLTPSRTTIAVGRLVEVASRTWPGINRPGGVARITRVYYYLEQDDEVPPQPQAQAQAQAVVQEDLNADLQVDLQAPPPPPTHVDVSYIVGRSKEKRVPIEYVTLAPQYETLQVREFLLVDTSTTSDTMGATDATAAAAAVATTTTSLRDRGLILGRCLRCGSLRSDCGSCDWRMEEQGPETVVTTTTTTTAITTPSSHRRRRQRQRQRQRQHAHKGMNQDDETSSEDNEEDSSGDDGDGDGDDDDVALRQLIQNSRTRYRKHLRNKRKYQTLQSLEDETKDNSHHTNTTMASNPNTMNSTSQKDIGGAEQEGSHRHSHSHSHSHNDHTCIDDDDSDDDDDDDDLDELIQRSQRRYRKHLRQRRQWQRRLDGRWTSSTKAATVLNRRPMHHQSVLETLHVNPAVTAKVTATTASTSRRRSKTIKPKSIGRRATLDAIMELDDDESQSRTTTTAATMTTPPKRSSTKNIMDVDQETHSPIGVTESPSPESMGPASLPFHDDDDDDNDEHNDNDGNDDTWQDTPSNHRLSIESVRRNRLASYLKHNSCDDVVGRLPDDQGRDTTISSNTLELAEFIQPEGQEAAESLPQDMVDRTKSVPYSELVPFFHTLASDLEDDLLPDFRLEIAQVQRQFRRLQQSCSRRNRTMDSNLQDPKVVQDILQTCTDLWGHATHQLVREGTDQCHAALRRMEDRRLFKKYKPQLTSGQRKELRGSVAMDVRDLRMNALEESVDDLVRQLHTLTEGCEDLLAASTTLEGDEEDGGMDGGSSSEGEESVEYETQDLLPMNHTANGETRTQPLDPSERLLAAFDPHCHASIIRKRKTQPHDGSERQSKISSTTTTGMRRKRVRSSLSDPLVSFIVPDDHAPKHRKESIGSSKSNAASGEPRRVRMGPASSGETAGDVNGLLVLAMAQGAPIADNDERQTSVVLGGDDEDEEDPSEGATSHLFASVEATSQQSSRPRQAVQGKQPNQRLTSRRILGPSTETIHEEPSYQRDRVPISERMQAFLDKNNALEWPEEDNENGSFLPRKRRAGGRSSRGIGQKAGQQSNSVPHGEARAVDYSVLPGHRDRTGRGRSTQRPIFEASAADDETENISPETLNRMESRISTAFLLSRFEEGPCSSIEQTQPRRTVSIPTLSTQLRSSFSTDSVKASRVLNQIQHALSDGIAPADKTYFGDAAVELLRSHCGVTLLEIIARESIYLEAHVKLLSALVRYGNEVNSLMDRKQFLDLLVLQLVEAVYALLHPEGWALPTRNKEGCLIVLEPLCDALATVIPLSEAVSRCVVSQLECQRWRITEAEDFVFVSSLDPNVWKDFVESGTYAFKPEALRYTKLGKVWPRIEVDSIWNLLLFFGRPNSREDSKSEVRWQLVWRLFANSALVKADSDEAKLPPSESHLTTFEWEMDNFVQLLQRGTMGSLPASDKVIAKLIERAILLQAEDYRGNEESRMSSFPAFNAGIETAMGTERFVSRLWKATHSLLLKDESNVDSQPKSVFDICFESVNQQAVFKYKDLLLPKSGLVQKSMALLLAWAYRLPVDKKVRRIRFSKQLRGLRDSLIKIEKEISNESVNTEEHNTFAAAFLESSPTEIGEGKIRTCAFLREAVTQVHIVESISCRGEDGRSTGVALSTIHEIWNYLAPYSLRRHRDLVLQIYSTDAPLSSEDEIAVFSSATSMSTIAFLCVGLDPWCLGVRHHGHVLSMDIHRQREMIEYYSFPISCIFSSVDYLCRCSGDSRLLCHLYSVLTILFNSLVKMVNNSGVDPSLNRLAVQVTSTHIPILIQCFRFHVGDAKDPTDKTSLRLVLCALQSVLNFQAIRKSKYAKTSTAGTYNSNAEATSTAEDDFLGDDHLDALLASVDSTLPTDETIEASNQDGSEIATFFFEVLAIIKPSERFKCPNAERREQKLQISSHGASYLEESSDMLCDCLVAVAAAENYDQKSGRFWEGLLRLVQPSYESKLDADFKEKVARRLWSEICLSSDTYQALREFVAANSQVLLLGVIETIINPSRLRHYPSCNVDAIRAVGGENAAREAIVRLDVFNGVEGSKRVIARYRNLRLNADKAWTAVEKLGTTLPAGQHNAALARVLKKADNDLLSSHEVLLGAFSLEKEALKCFCLLRNVVSVLKRGNPQHFEQISASIISSLASQTLSTAVAMNYLNEEATAVSNQNHDLDTERGSMTALLSAYTELFFATTAWIMRESPNDTTIRWNGLLKTLRDQLFFPILMGRSVGIPLNMQRLVKDCKATSNWDPTSSANLPRSSRLPDRLFNGFFGHAARRCYQLLLAPCPDSQWPNLQNIVIEAAIGGQYEKEVEMAKLIGGCFVEGQQHGATLKLGPLEDGIDRYMGFLESTLLSSTFSMRANRVNAVRAFILPRLGNKCVTVEMKRRILRLLTHMLSDEEALSSTEDAISIRELLCSLLRAFRGAIFHCLKSNTVDSEFVVVALECGANIAKLKVHGKIDPQTWLGWSREQVMEMDLEGMSPLIKYEGEALFLFSFFKWLESLARYMAFCKESGRIDRWLDDFRLTDERLERPDTSLMSALLDVALVDDTINELEQLEAWTKVVLCCENRIFPPKTESNTRIVNKYLKTSHVQELGNESIREPWIPSNAIKRSAKEYLAVIVSMS